jgi:serine phosphatase RsbU (regulator of sigma subunit)
LKPDAEKASFYLLMALVLAGIAAIAYADHLVVSLSLAFLYFLPLALSALIHKLRTSLLLVLVCVALSDWFGTPDHSGWRHPVRNIVAAVGFATVVLFVNRLTAQRATLKGAVRTQAEELAREMRLAAEVQRRLLPQYPPSIPGFEISARMKPAKAIGGDLYDFMEMPNGRLGIVIADIAGKGVSAGLFMPAVKIALRTNIHDEGSLERILKKTNQIIYELTDDERFASLFYATLDPTAHHLSYINAGHQPPLLIRAATREAFWLETGGPVLGLLTDVNFQSASLELHPGDLLVLYTDGVVETHGPNDEEFSRQRLLSVVASHQQDSLESLTDAIYSAVATFSPAEAPEDDATVVIVRAKEI